MSILIDISVKAFIISTHDQSLFTRVSQTDCVDYVKNVDICVGFVC